MILAVLSELFVGAVEERIRNATRQRRNEYMWACHLSISERQL
jgi:hypothetical protein